MHRLAAMCRTTSATVPALSPDLAPYSTPYPKSARSENWYDPPALAPERQRYHPPEPLSVSANLSCIQPPHAMSTSPPTHAHYLVIGGCGFLGRHIVDALLGRGETNVAVFDIVQRHFDE